MICKTCGYNNPEDAAFCEQCGTSIFHNHLETNNTSKAKKRKIVLAVLIMLCILSIVGICIIGKKMSDPEHALKQYLKTVINEDWDNAYNYLDVPENSFMNASIYETAMKDGGISKIKDYKIEYVKDNVYKVMFQKKDGTAVVQKLTLKEQRDNYIRIFKNYKIQPEGMLNHTFTMRVPKGTGVKFDGINLTKQMLTTTQTNTFIDEYKLIGIPDGNYNVQFALPYAEILETSVSVKNNEIYDLELDQAVFKDASKKLLYQKAEGAMEIIYDCALNEERTKNFNNLFISENTAIQSYEKIRKYLTKEGTSLRKMKFTNLKLTELNNSFDLTASSKDSKGWKVKLVIPCNLELTLVNKGKSENVNKVCRQEITYSFDGDDWKINDIMVQTEGAGL